MSAPHATLILPKSKTLLTGETATAARRAAE